VYFFLNDQGLGISKVQRGKLLRMGPKNKDGVIFRNLQNMGTKNTVDTLESFDLLWACGGFSC